MNSIFNIKTSVWYWGKAHTHRGKNYLVEAKMLKFSTIPERVTIVSFVSKEDRVLMVSKLIIHLPEGTLYNSHSAMTGSREHKSDTFTSGMCLQGTQ